MSVLFLIALASSPVKHNTNYKPCLLATFLSLKWVNTGDTMTQIVILDLTQI